jgi:hypothetical protein
MVRKEIKIMSKWIDEDIATNEFSQEYLQEFREGIFNNPACAVDEKEKPKIEEALNNLPPIF